MIKVIQGLVDTPLGVKTVDDAPFSLDKEKEAYFVGLGVCRYADNIAAFAKPTIEAEKTPIEEKPKKTSKSKAKDEAPVFTEELPQ